MDKEFHPVGRTAKKWLGVIQKVELRTVADNLIAALESGNYGAMYWLHKATYKGAAPIPKGEIWYDTPELLGQNGPIFEVVSDHPTSSAEKPIRKIISRTAIQHGLQLMAEKSGEAFARAIHQEGDASDADIMLQYIVHGEIVFG